MPHTDALPPLTADEAATLPLNCPHCGRPLHYTQSDRTAHVYQCGRDGAFRLTVRGLYPVPH